MSNDNYSKLILDELRRINDNQVRMAEELKATQTQMASELKNITKTLNRITQQLEGLNK